MLAMLPLAAQTGQEWIDFNQAYFKIPVGKNGIYRLTYPNLIAAGVPPSIDPKKIQIFHRGKEVPIFIQGEQDGQLNSGDFIEFYGRQNTGESDTELYTSPAAQPHTYYNIYSDTTSYFLALGNSSGARMQTINEIASGPSSVNYHLDEKLLILKDEYAGGVTDELGEIQQSAFEEGEGWTGSQINVGQTVTYTVQGLTNTNQTAGTPQLEVLLTGRSVNNHVIEVYAGSRLLSTVNLTMFQSAKTSVPLLWSDISSDGKLVVGLKVTSGRASAGFLRVLYPQQTDMNAATEKLFIIPANLSSQSSIQIVNAPAGTRLYDVTDPDNVSSVNTSQTSTLNFILPPSATDKRIFSASVVSTPVLKRVNFRPLNAGAYNYVIVTHPLLRKPSGGYTDPVKAYAEYRSLPQGGGYDTLVINIQQLYDQFNYGEQSPLGIYHFVKFLSNVKPPQYLFLIGKGLEANWNYYRDPNSFTQFRDLVPTAGYPASDMLYTAGLSGLDHVPGSATGRLAATSADQVVAYLNKVKETEALPYDDLRRKNLLHLSGGIYEGEPALYRSYLEDYAAIAAKPYLGGQVKAIAKQSTSLKTINVSDEVNKGVALITFFGHSSTSSTDFDIGNVTDPVMGYKNQGKYPVLLMNGCLAGSFFLNTTVFGENWINAANKGALGFIAHTFFGFNYSLRQYSELFYQIGFSDSLFVGKGLGDIQKELAKRYLQNYGEGTNEIVQVQEMVLLGDPAVALFGAKKPDYEINTGNVSFTSFDGQPITAVSDSFKLSVVVRNFGMASKKPMHIQVTRTLPDNSSIVYHHTFNAVMYSDTLSFVIPGKVANGFGVNQFIVKVDSDESIDELNEDNNTLSYSYFIALSRAKNLFPADFAIVNDTHPRLSLQHSDPLSGEREFLLEVDTVKTFNSTFKKQYKIKGDVLASQIVDLLDTDSLVYYWRSKLADSLANESMAWDVRSFTYIRNGREGWAQMQFPQYDDNALVGLVREPALKRLEFLENSTDVAIKTFSASTGKPVDSVSVKIDGTEYNIYNEMGGTFGCRTNTINLIAFDKTTAAPYLGRYFTFPEIYQLGRRLMCGREPYIINSYQADELTMGSDVDLLTYINNVHVGDSVILFSMGDAGYASWPTEAKQKLGELGISVSQIDALHNGDGVIIYARKGASPGTAKVFVTTALENKLVIDRTVTGRYTSGIMTTTLIGPAQKWGSLDVRYAEEGITDEVLFDIIGVKSDGAEMPLLSGLHNNTDISSIDASIYPYIKVSFKTRDETLVTAAQLKHWIVLYEPVAEGLLLYKGDQQPKSIQEGQPWSGPYSFVNISNKAFNDSLTVNYDLVNPETFATTHRQLKIAAPLPGDTTTFSTSLATEGHEGWNNVEVFVNPRILSEQNYDNNRILLSRIVNVQSDRNPPVLDVTIDNRHIQQDEFVSSSPKIHITVWDNNPFLLKRDTIGVNMFMAYDCDNADCDFKPIYFTNSRLSWIPETATSEFTVDFNPENLEDGTYVFRIEAKDAHGNSSGSEPYAIRFKVKSENTFTLMPPYPNPFAYKANFSFVVTGDELPSVFTLQILNIKGELVQAFSEKDLPELHVGTNNLAWSPTDTSGAALSNGIYFYRMMIQCGDQLYSQNGKLVLSR